MAFARRWTMAVLALVVPLAGVSAQPALGAGTVPANESPITQQQMEHSKPMQFIPIEGVTFSGGSYATVALKGGQSLTVPNSIGATLIHARDERGLPNVTSTGTAASVARVGRRHTKPRAHTANIEVGDCGYDYLFIRKDSNNSGIFAETGWNVEVGETGPVYYYHWLIEGENITYGRSWYGEWGEEYGYSSWSTTHTAAKGAGYYFGVVDSEESYALGLYGACFALPAYEFAEVP